MRHQILKTGKVTLIGDSASNFRMLAGERDAITIHDQTAFAMATCYVARQHGFQADNIYWFTAVDGEDRVQPHTDIEQMKAAIDFFFREVRCTDSYVKQFPRNSVLYAKEADRWFGTTLIAV